MSDQPCLQFLSVILYCCLLLFVQVVLARITYLDAVSDRECPCSKQ